LVLRNGRVFLPGGLVEADILIEDGRIREIKKNITGKGLNLHGKLVVPGLIDVHVHFRDPGATQKEDFKTGSQAALNGGVTTVFDQPNTAPQPTDAKKLKAKITEAKRKCMVNFNINAGVGSSNVEKLWELRQHTKVFGEIFMCESVGDLIVSDTADLYRCLAEIGKLKGIPTMHAENQQINDYFKKRLSRKTDPEAYCDARPPVSEVEAVSRALALNTGRMHFCHVSTAQALVLIKNARSQARRVTCEVTPHHLFLSRDQMKTLKAQGKMNPPLRSIHDIRGLWEGIHDGTVDMIATDHAPHLASEKRQGIWEAPAGIPGLETMLPLLLNEVNRDRLSISRLVELTSEMPARLFGLVGKGLITKGYDADLTVIDLDKEWRVDSSDLYTKCGWSPWEGRKLKGRPVLTLLGGETAMKDGEVYKVKGRCLNEKLR
jgi:dihydroorotase